MNLPQAIVLGIVEGFTEFLPISSTAHLIIASSLLGLEQTAFISFFEVFIQAGAVIAVVALYATYLVENRRLIPLVVVSFLPTAVVGFLTHDIIKTVLFSSQYLIVSTLTLIGIVFIAVELLIGKKIICLTKELRSITYAHGILIGLLQSLALFPGVSRAGAVMVTMMILGYKRKDAAVFSFLLAIPTIFGASAFDFVKTDFSLMPDNAIPLLTVGFVTSMVSALIFVKLLITFLQKHSLVAFGIYRIVLGLLLLILLESFTFRI